MGKFSLYNIPLRGLSEGTHTFDYHLDNQFFKSINDDDSDLKKGDVKVNLIVKGKSNLFELNFNIQGEVFIPCDRCLDDVTMEVNIENKLIVKFGQEYSEESDEIVIIPEEDGELNIAWFLYEFISLSLPIKHIHPQGQCNRLMTSKLNKHRATTAEDTSENEEDEFENDSPAETDSRWDPLKDLTLED